MIGRDGPAGEQCTARSKRTKEGCKRMVIGGGVCVMHGGAAPQVKAARLQRVAIAQAARFHGPVAVTGGQALLEELARTNGQVRALEDTLGLEEHLPSQEHALVQRFMAERGHLRQVAESVVRLDIDAKLLTAEQLQGDQIVMLLREVVIGLGFNPADEDVRLTIIEALHRTDAASEEIERARNAQRQALR